MICNLKALGLLVVAVLAMSAMLTSAAQAEVGGVFTASPDTKTPTLNATIHGDQTGAVNFFQIEGATGTKVECEIGTFTGTLTGGKATEVTITPDYKDCKAGVLPMTFTMNGCDYTFTQPTRINGKGSGEYTGKTDLTCPENKGPIIHIYLEGTPTAHAIDICTIEFKPGAHTAGPPTHYNTEFEGHVIYKNKAEAEVTKSPVVVKKDDITAEMTIEKVPWKKSGGCGAKEGTDGVFKSTITLLGLDDINDSPNPTLHTEHYHLWIADEA